MTESTRKETDSPSAEACWALLERVGASTQLCRAPRLREFLLYVGQRSLKEGCDQVHEQEIGVEVFGRPDSYDTSVDGIVRSNATILRKRIEAYFESEGLHEKLIMEIPRGSYVPVFQHRAVAPQIKEEPLAPGSAPFSEPPDAIADVPQIFDRHRWMTPSLIALVVVLTIGCVTLWLQNRAKDQLLYPLKSSPSLAALWSEFLGTRQDTDVVLEDSSFFMVQTVSNKTFSFNDYLNRTYITQLEAQNFDPEIRKILNQLPNKILGRASEVSLTQRIVALDPLAKNLHLYNAREYRPALLDQDNVIVLGGTRANPWVELFENRLNFTEENYSDRLSPITNKAPARGEQAVYTPGTFQYCVVAYLPNPSNKNKILLVVGTAAEATEAGENFILSESQLSNFLKILHTTRVPYFEVLLKTSLVTGTALNSTIEAYRTYPNPN